MGLPKISARRLAGLLPPMSGHGPRYAALAEAIRLLIGDGRLLAGTRMPSERDFTAALGVSRTTVARAYDLLREEGILESRRGSGSVVTTGGGRPHAGDLGQGIAVPPLGSAAVGQQPGVADLTCAASAGRAELVPWFAAALERLPAHVTDSGYHPLGLPVLREAVARRFTMRGLPTEADQVIVTTGALAALATVARAYVRPGERVLIENPTYPGAVATVRHSGARLVGLPLEAEPSAAGDRRPPAAPAAIPEAMAALVRQTAPTLAVLTPDFHNPTGRLMRASERAAIAEVLRAGRVRAIIDESLVETGLGDGDMPPPFGAFARDAITVGSVSKSHWGGLRIGWIRAPREEIPSLAAARLGLDVGVPIMEQLVVAGLFAEGVYALPGERTAHRCRHDTLVEAVRERLPTWQFVDPGGGLSLWCRLPGQWSSAIVAAARPRGTLLVPGATFGIDGTGFERYLRLPFALEPPALRRAVDDIAAAAAQVEGSIGDTPALPAAPRAVVA